MLKQVILLLSLFVSTLLFSQRTNNIVKDTLSGAAFERMVEQSYSLYTKELSENNQNYDSIFKSLGYADATVPEFTDEQICEHLTKLNESSSFGFECNSISLSMIRFFMNNRRSLIKICLGRSELYFSMYEEKLTEYDLPSELKYLSVIESGLRPQVKSHAGACGLWQFMYATGKYYGLTENSYIDERMDPAKATDAACRYLKKLFSIYGDWNLALAAYNAGPGNVNKAIRRSGGKRTYWEVRPFLPKETQGYVPNFIAAAYLMENHAIHNISPAEAKINFFQTDTMCLNRGIHMQTIDKIVNWSAEDIGVLNPVYKTTYIPNTFPNQCITGPIEKIGLLVSMEDSLYVLEDRMYGTPGSKPIVLSTQTPVTNANGGIVVSSPVKTPPKPLTKEQTSIQITYHKVKQGENLGKIASQYNVTVQNIMDWNAMSSTQVILNQLLKIEKTITTLVPIEVETNTTTSTKLDGEEEVETGQEGGDEVEEPVAPTPKPGTPAPAVKKKYYSVRSGDNYSKIASKNHISVSQLKRLNPGVNPGKMRVGQKLRVK